MARDKDIVMDGGVAARPGKQKKHLKPYHTLYESNYRDVPKTLRKIAKDLERGEYGGINEAALVLDAENGKYMIYGFGPHYTNFYGTLGLFDLAKGELRGVIYDNKARQEAMFMPPEPPKEDK